MYTTYMHMQGIGEQEAGNAFLFHFQTLMMNTRIINTDNNNSDVTKLALLSNMLFIVPENEGDVVMVQMCLEPIMNSIYNVLQGLVQHIFTTLPLTIDQCELQEHMSTFYMKSELVKSNGSLNEMQKYKVKWYKYLAGMFRIGMLYVIWPGK